MVNVEAQAKNNFSVAMTLDNKDTIYALHLKESIQHIYTSIKIYLGWSTQTLCSGTVNQQDVRLVDPEWPRYFGPNWMLAPASRIEGINLPHTLQDLPIIHQEANLLLSLLSLWWLLL